MLQTLLVTGGITVGIAALVFALIGVKMLFKKNATFVGTCASNNPYLREQGITSCPVCGSQTGECQQQATAPSRPVSKDPLEN